MNTSLRYRAAALLTVTTLVGTSLLAAGPTQAQDPPAEHNMASMKGMTEGSNALHKSMMTGMKGMQGMRMTGDVDRDFASMMAEHHRQAIAMARIELEHGKDAKLREQAQKIIDDSQKDLAVLEAQK